MKPEKGQLEYAILKEIEKAAENIKRPRMHPKRRQYFLKLQMIREILTTGKHQ